MKTLMSKRVMYCIPRYPRAVLRKDDVSEHMILLPLFSLLIPFQVDLLLSCSFFCRARYLTPFLAVFLSRYSFCLSALASAISTRRKQYQKYFYKISKLLLQLLLYDFSIIQAFKNYIKVTRLAKSFSQRMRLILFSGIQYFQLNVN